MTVLIIVLALIFVLLLNGQVRMKRMEAKNNQKFKLVSDRIYEILSDCDQNEIKTAKIMSDSGRYYILAAGKENNSIALASETDSIRLKKNSKKSFKFIINRLDNGKEFDSIICRITSTDLKEPYDVYFCEKKHKANSYVGKLTIKNAESFKKMLLGLKFKNEQ